MAEKIGSHNKIRIMSADSKCTPSSRFLMNKIEMFLHLNGYEVFKCDQPDVCDIVLINTFSRSKATAVDTRILIERSLKEAVVKRVIIFGHFPKKIDIDSRVLKIGTKELNRFDALFEHRIPMERIPADPLDSRSFSMKYDFVPISQGCKQNCSFCNINSAQRDLVSRTIDDIIHDIQQGLRDGKNDFFLVGDDCGSYGIDLGTDLVGLIKEIMNRCPEAKLKISPFYPGHLIRLFPALKESIATGKIVYMNIPLQAGSKRILKLMNRDYNITTVKNIINKIKDLAPACCFSTHIIVNFPTESREEFLSSLRLIKLFDNFLIFNYSDSSGISAGKIFPKVRRVEKEKRLRICRDLVKRLNRGQVVLG